MCVVQDPESLERENDEVIGLLAGKAQELRNVRVRWLQGAACHKLSVPPAVHHTALPDTDDTQQRAGVCRNS